MGVPGFGQEHVPVEYRGAAHLVHDSREQARLHRAEEGSRLSRRDERGDGERRCAHARAGRGGRVRRAAEAQRAPQRPRLLPGAVRQAGRAGLPGRQAAAPRAQHDLRRRRREAARHRPGAMEKALGKQFGQESQGGHPQPGRAQGGLGLRRSQLHEAGPVLHRADERDGRQDSDRRQRGGGHRLHVGRRHGRRLVPDYAVLVALRIADRLHEEIPRRQGRPARRRSRSCRPKTRSRRSAW